MGLVSLKIPKCHIIGLIQFFKIFNYCHIIYLFFIFLLFLYIFIFLSLFYTFFIFLSLFMHFSKYSITDILFICFLSFVVFYKLFYSHATSYNFIHSPYNENIFMGDQFLYLFINFSINYLLNS